MPCRNALFSLIWCSKSTEIQLAQTLADDQAQTKTELIANGFKCLYTATSTLDRSSSDDFLTVRCEFALQMRKCKLILIKVKGLNCSNILM